MNGNGKQFVVFHVRVTSVVTSVVLCVQKQRNLLVSYLCFSLTMNASANKLNLGSYSIRFLFLFMTCNYTFISVGYNSILKIENTTLFSILKIGFRIISENYSFEDYFEIYKLVLQTSFCQELTCFISPHLQFTLATSTSDTTISLCA